MDHSQTQDLQAHQALIDTPRQIVDKKKSTKRKRAMVLELLATSTNLTHADIATIAGTCTKTVSRAAQVLRDTGGKLESEDKRDQERESYRRLINERVPHEARVEGILGQIADVRFALPAIKYVDQITGVGPVADPEGVKTPQPMFAFAGDASINVTINQTSVKNPSEIVVSEGKIYSPVPASDSKAK